jgi:transposase-like protein
LLFQIQQPALGQISISRVGQYSISADTLVAALAEMYVQGVSTRKVKAITEELCGHQFSASTISRCWAM